MADVFVTFTCDGVSLDPFVLQGVTPERFEKYLRRVAMTVGAYLTNPGPLPEDHQLMRFIRKLEEPTDA